MPTLKFTIAQALPAPEHPKQTINGRRHPLRVCVNGAAKLLLLNACLLSGFSVNAQSVTESPPAQPPHAPLHINEQLFSGPCTRVTAGMLQGVINEVGCFVEFLAFVATEGKPMADQYPGEKGDSAYKVLVWQAANHKIFNVHVIELLAYFFGGIFVSLGLNRYDDWRDKRAGK